VLLTARHETNLLENAVWGKVVRTSCVLLRKRRTSALHKRLHFLGDSKDLYVLKNCSGAWSYLSFYHVIPSGFSFDVTVGLVLKDRKIGMRLGGKKGILIQQSWRNCEGVCPNFSLTSKKFSRVPMGILKSKMRSHNYY